MVLEDVNKLYKECENRRVNLNPVNDLYREVTKANILDDSFDCKSKDIPFYEDLLQKLKMLESKIIELMMESSVTNKLNEIRRLLYKYIIT